MTDIQTGGVATVLEIMANTNHQPKVIIDGLPILFSSTWYERLDFDDKEEWMLEHQPDDSLFILMLRLITIINQQHRRRKDVIYGHTDTLLEIAKIGKKEGVLRTIEYDIINRMCKDQPSPSGVELCYFLNDKDLDVKNYIKKHNFSKILRHVKANNPWTKIITLTGETDEVWDYLKDCLSSSAMNKTITHGALHEEIRLGLNSDTNVPVTVNIFEEGIMPKRSTDTSQYRIELFAPSSGVVQPHAKTIVDMKMRFNNLNEYAILITKNPSELKKFEITPQIAIGNIKITLNNPTARPIHFHRGEKIACALVIRVYMANLESHQAMDV